MVQVHSDCVRRTEFNYLEGKVDILERGFYGDTRNKVVGVPDRLDAIETKIEKTNQRIEVMIRQSLYWRMAQTGLLLLIAGILAGALLR